MSSGTANARRCVYTVLTGDYEPLNEQPGAHGSGLPFICFTDNLGLKSDTWQLRGFDPPFAGDKIRSQRAVKIQPHKYVPEFDQSLYIDNCVVLQAPPERLFQIADLSSGICLPFHSFRDRLLDEFGAVSADELDDPVRIAEQLGDYLAAFPQVLMQKPMWTGMMLRDHRDPQLRAAMEFWLAHVYRYSRRDQLSAPVACAAMNVQPGNLGIDNHRSEFHSWPHHNGRNMQQRKWPKDNEATALRKQIEDVNQRLDRLQYEHSVLLNATTWRMLEPARALLRLIRDFR